MRHEDATDVVFVVTSGASVIFVNPIAEELSRRGRRVVIVANFDDVGAGIPVRSGSVPSVSFPFHRRPKPVADLVHLFRLARLIRSIGPTVVHASTPKAGLLGVLAGRLTRRPAVIYQARGFRAETATGTAGRLQRFLERTSCRLADTVIVNSTSLKETMVAAGVLRPSAGVVVGCGGSIGVDTSRFVPSEPSGSADGRFTLGFVGRLHADKGIASVISAFSELKTVCPDARLLIVGGSDTSDAGGTERALATLAATLPTDDIEVTGFVTDVVPHLQRMDAMVFPSSREGLPNAPLEAQACGVPVVAYRVTGVVDAVADGVGGVLVDFDDRRALAAAVVRLALDPARRRAMGRAGRRFVIDRFERSAVVAGNADLIEAAADRTAR